MKVLSETGMMKHLLTKGEIVNSKRLAREFGCTVYEIAGELKLLRKKGVVEHIRPRKWSVNKEALIEAMNENSMRKLATVNGRLFKMQCVMCYNEEYWSELVGEDGLVECHWCGHRQKKSG